MARSRDNVDLLEALGRHLEAGDADEAARLVAEAPTGDLDRVDLAELRDALARIGPALDRVPWAIVAYARLLEVTVHVDERSALLDRLEETAAGADDPALARAVATERARDCARDGDPVRAIEQAGRVLEDLGRGEELTRARALAALGRAYAFRRAEGDAVRAQEALREAAAGLRRLDEPFWEAQALVWLGYGVLLPEGHDAEALDTLRRARSRAPVDSTLQGVATTFLISALLASGSAGEASILLDELEAGARERHDSRLLGYVAWDRAEVAALGNDPIALAASLAAVERHQSDWWDHPTGAEFLAAASVMAQRVGDEAVATAYLERAEPRATAHGWPEIAAAARAGFEARFGDPIAADALLVAAAGDPQVSRRERWHLGALRAVAADRAGDEDGARRMAALAIEEAAVLGLSHLLAAKEPVLAQRILSLAAAGGSGAARDALTTLEVAPQVSIRLVGEFSVTVDGEDRTPAGQPATLVKLLALAGGEMTVDQVLEALWPEGASDTGRRRLRNLLHRLGARWGRLVARRGEVLRLPGAHIDLDGLDAELAAVDAGGEGAAGAARRALGMASGTLLPEDPYADWAVYHRERLHHRLARAADLLSREALATGDARAATAWMERAVELQPWDMDRRVAAVEAALAAGDERHARWLAEQAARAHEELGIAVPESIAERLG